MPSIWVNELAQALQQASKRLQDGMPDRALASTLESMAEQTTAPLADTLSGIAAKLR
jgi:hypothetical protein